MQAGFDHLPFPPLLPKVLVMICHLFKYWKRFHQFCRIDQSCPLLRGRIPEVSWPLS